MTAQQPEDKNKDRKKKPLASREVFVIMDRSLDPRLVVYHDPRGSLAEQYRFFRTRLLASNQEKAVQTFALTSSRPEEGKSVSAANVALVLADLPSTSVCLVDADLRSPSQASLFGVAPGIGLSDYLTNDKIPLQDLVLPTRLENLSLVTAGSQTTIPSAHLGSGKTEELMSYLTERFHYVVFDTPPVGAFPDAAILGARVDGIVLVIRMKKTPRKVVETSVEMLRRAGCTILSTLLTGADSDKYWNKIYKSK